MQDGTNSKVSGVKKMLDETQRKNLRANLQQNLTQARGDEGS